MKLWFRKILGLDDPDLNLSLPHGNCVAWFMGRFGIPVTCHTRTNILNGGRWLCDKHWRLGDKNWRDEP